MQNNDNEMQIHGSVALIPIINNTNAITLTTYYNPI